MKNVEDIKNPFLRIPLFLMMAPIMIYNVLGYSIVFGNFYPFNDFFKISKQAMIGPKK